MSYDDFDEDEDHDGPYSPARERFEPGNPETIELSRLSDGSPVLRIGNNRGTALDCDMPLPTIPEAAIGWVRTQRGHHVIFPPTEEGRRAAEETPLADPGHREASIECGSWDLRVLDKETLRPRILHRHGWARAEGTPEAAAFDAIAAVWMAGGGVVE